METTSLIMSILALLCVIPVAIVLAIHVGSGDLFTLIVCGVMTTLCLIFVKD